MIEGKTIGIDLGGTNVRAGLVVHGTVQNILSQKLDKTGSASEIILQLFDVTDRLVTEPVDAIGIGVSRLGEPGKRNGFRRPEYSRLEGNAA